MFLIDMVFGGSLGFVLGHVSIRKVLMLALIGCFLVSLTQSTLIKRWQLVLLAALTLALLIWGFFIPILHGIDLGHAVAESSPLLGLLLVFPMGQAIQCSGARRYLEVIHWCLAIVSIIIIFVWILATFFESPEYAFGLKLFYLSVSGDDFGTYIGPISDGSFRVMWITCMLLPFALMYTNFYSFRLGWSLFYMVAIYATGTRSFLYASFAILFIMLLRHRPVFTALLTPFVFAAILASAHVFEGVRLFHLASELDSDSARFEQLFSLLRLFADHPFLGAGFGAHADILRSDLAPFSYELTYVALLAKLGGVGFLGFLMLIFFVINTALCRFPSKRIEIFLLLCCFFFITSTNPYLLNFVGMTIVSLLLALIFTKNGSTKKILPSLVLPRGAAI